jgi:hypothetical protein
MKAKRDTLSPLIGTIAGVIAEPYKTFFAQLYAAGRVTDAEMTALRTTCEDRLSRLSTIVDQALEHEAMAEIAKSSSAARQLAQQAEQFQLNRRFDTVLHKKPTPTPRPRAKKG